jgi:hypothetical protein
MRGSRTIGLCRQKERGRCECVTLTSRTITRIHSGLLQESLNFSTALGVDPRHAHAQWTLPTTGHAMLGRRMMMMGGRGHRFRLIVMVTALFDGAASCADRSHCRIGAHKHHQENDRR